MKLPGVILQGAECCHLTVSSVGDNGSSCPRKVRAALQCIIILIIVLEMGKLKGSIQVEVMNYLDAESQR